MCGPKWAQGPKCARGPKWAHGPKWAQGPKVGPIYIYTLFIINSFKTIGCLELLTIARFPFFCRPPQQN